jgi:hypothetical protein
MGAVITRGVSRPTLIVYSRPQCHLCDIALAALAALQRRIPFAVEVRNVEERPEWESAFGEQVPVGFLGKRKVFKYRIDAAKLQRALLSGR